MRKLLFEQDFEAFVLRITEEPTYIFHFDTPDSEGNLLGINEDGTTGWCPASMLPALKKCWYVEPGGEYDYRFCEDPGDVIEAAEYWLDDVEPEELADSGMAKIQEIMEAKCNPGN